MHDCNFCKKKKDIPKIDFLLYRKKINMKKHIIISGHSNLIHKGYLEYFNITKVHADELSLLWIMPYKEG
jgi:hypothetical protein